MNFLNNMYFERIKNLFYYIIFDHSKSVIINTECYNYKRLQNKNDKNICKIYMPLYIYMNYNNKQFNDKYDKIDELLESIQKILDVNKKIEYQYKELLKLANTNNFKLDFI
ncbi:hypothetical protein MYSEV_164 [Mythimna separata entomopoxvirus 'L']|uniref:N1R/p28-like protein n=1 Tax=Mythimna separata entomopoxvirus 'L' TaxID=1293572 RepID=A0A916KQA3_9POXV|nr:hypothetical protein MYSEV_164 [Mythimna separata entomopoxvirus 'L']CCU56362.1 hypothetical protein MYSEV_164 [Mythimna separata entomopoxvirus 'L']